ncbi:MAG: hypothetical protein KIT43_04660 [Bauldia sp.]|nr:hypothetical protein [Bauldia sp.]
MRDQGTKLNFVDIELQKSSVQQERRLALKSQPRVQSPMTRDNARPKKQPVPIVNNRFSAALSHLAASLVETSGVSHTGIKGGEREEIVRAFFARHLPRRYKVEAGEVVDQLNGSSPQLDAMIFDEIKDFSLAVGKTPILAAEALLASIEVKSRLDKAETIKCLSSARKLRELMPFRSPVSGHVGKKKPGVLLSSARYFHCVFAFDTDILPDNWLDAELRRFNSGQAPVPIDLLYVRGRGLINFASRRAKLESASGGALAQFYFGILNFIDREGRRRAPTPYSDYATVLGGKDWITF